MMKLEGRLEMSYEANQVRYYASQGAAIADSLGKAYEESHKKWQPIKEAFYMESAKFYLQRLGEYPEFDEQARQILAKAKELGIHMSWLPTEGNAWSVYDYRNLIVVTEKLTERGVEIKTTEEEKQLAGELTDHLVQWGRRYA